MMIFMILITVAAFVFGVPAGLLIWWLIATIAKRRQAAREVRGFEVRSIEERAG
jgi:hypothetical protein